jgi:AcrR family transcriptional regulator
VTAADRGREVRRRLLAAAVALIVERGWGGVSTRVLAERAGLAPGLVHYHFASLPALLAEAAVGAMRTAVAALDRDQASDGAETVDLLLAAVDHYTGQDPTSLLFVETYLAATRDEELRRAVAGVLAGVRDRLATRLADHGVPDARGTAAVLAAAVDGILLHRALDPTLTAATVAPVLRRLVPPILE